MPIVNFSIPQVLSKQVNEAIKTKGFASKAEFFRFAAFDYLRHLEDHRLNNLSNKLADTLSKKYAGKKMPSIEDQFKKLDKI